MGREWTEEHRTLLRSERVPPEFMCWNLIASVKVLRARAFRQWQNLQNEIQDLIGGVVEPPPFPLSFSPSGHVRTQPPGTILEAETGPLETQTCWRLELALPSLRTEKQMSYLYIL